MKQKGIPQLWSHTAVHTNGKVETQRARKIKQRGTPFPSFSWCLFNYFFLSPFLFNLYCCLCFHFFFTTATWTTLFKLSRVSAQILAFFFHFSSSFFLLVVFYFSFGVLCYLETFRLSVEHHLFLLFLFFCSVVGSWCTVSRVGRFPLYLGTLFRYMSIFERIFGTFLFVSVQSSRSNEDWRGAGKCQRRPYALKALCCDERGARSS